MNGVSCHYKEHSILRYRFRRRVERGITPLFWYLFTRLVIVVGIWPSKQVSTYFCQEERVVGTCASFWDKYHTTIWQTSFWVASCLKMPLSRNEKSVLMLLAYWLTFWALKMIWFEKDFDAFKNYSQFIFCHSHEKTLRFHGSGIWFF